jgi:hypothetical protein
MELESLEYKLLMEDGRDTEVLGRLAHLNVATAAYMAAIARYPKSNIALHHGARIIKRNDGEPVPDPPRDPNARSWSVHFIGGKRMERLGIVEAADEAGAIDAAAALFGVDSLRRKRLTVRSLVESDRRSPLIPQLHHVPAAGWQNAAARAFARLRLVAEAVRRERLPEQLRLNGCAGRSPPIPR